MPSALRPRDIICTVTIGGLRDQDLKKASATRPRAPKHTLDSKTFGVRLRAARKQLGWTLEQLHELSGVSITTISRAERGQLALGYENFSALGQALQMDMGSLFSGTGARAKQFAGFVLTKTGEGVSYRGVAFSYEFLGTTAVGKLMSPLIGTVHARSFNGEEDFAHHAGEEFVYVISGEVKVFFESGEDLRLKRGDSLYFDSRVGHAYISVSRTLARIIAVITSESDLMKTARAVPIKRGGGRAEKRDP